MGCRDSDIGDRPAASWRIPFERLSIPFHTPVCGALRQSHYGRGGDEAQPQPVSVKKNPHGAHVSLLERLQPDAAGIDCGQNQHFVAVPPGRDPQPVREFRTFTGELQRLADWLMQCGVKTVAMESTGVYWIPLYEILEQRGLAVLLVNAREVHNVPGRKSDAETASGCASCTAWDCCARASVPPPPSCRCAPLCVNARPWSRRRQPASSACSKP